jgi:hypothetical protein
LRGSFIFPHFLQMLQVLRRISGCVALGLVCLAARPASAQDSTLTRLSHRYHYTLAASADGTQFSGAGWERLRTDVLKSQFVLLGEDHGMAQIPLFAAAVARELKPKLYVGEVDPTTAQELTRLTAQPGLPTTYLRQYPMALCFGAMAEEFDLLRALRQQGTQLLGIDQVFAANAAPFYQQLAEQVKSPAARTYLKQRAATYQAQDLANERAGGQNLAMLHQSAASVDSLLAMTKAESPAVRQQAQDYAASYHIYTDTTGDNHQRRVNLMKRNLTLALRPYQTATGSAAPKMLFKLGGHHLGRGVSTLRFGAFYDVGNLVQNIADVQDQASLHILIVGKQGRKTSGLNPLFPDKNVTAYTDADYGPTKEIPIKPFTDQVSGSAWSVFDLRPLRKAITAGKLQVAVPALQRLLLGYDYLVIIPETTASRPI